MSFQTTQSVIEEAINNKKCVVIKYADVLRLIEPCALVSHSSGAKPDRLSALQISDDAAKSGIRTFLLTEIDDVQPTDRSVSQDALKYAGRVSQPNVVTRLT